MTDEKALATDFSRADVEAALARGTATFMGIELLVASGALVPRPETEILAL